MQLPHLSDRLELPKLLKHLGLNGIGAEVGVQAGWFSNQILENSDLSLLFSIDPWSQSEAKEEHLSSLELYEETKGWLAKYKYRSAILKMTSIEAAKLFSPFTFDFVYIDAEHTYEALSADLQAWNQLVKSGGILAGHDYCDLFPGIVQAVDEFVARYNYQLNTTELDFIWSGVNVCSWYVQV